jgi:hypothetical protein
MVLLMAFFLNVARQHVVVACVLYKWLTLTRVVRTCSAACVLIVYAT